MQGNYKSVRREKLIRNVNQIASDFADFVEIRQSPVSLPARPTRQRGSRRRPEATLLGMVDADPKAALELIERAAP